MIYLDNGATTLQKPPEVIQAVAYAMTHFASPGRGGYGAAMEAADVVFRCREALVALFHMENPEQVVFTSNATHGLNIALSSLVEPGDRVVISGYEHNAVTRPLHALGAELDVAAAPLFQPQSVVEAFERRLTPGTKAAVVNHVSNVFGFVQPVEEIAKLCAQRGIALVVDASQSAGVLPLDMEAVQAAFIAMPGHKGLYGPQGTGVLLCGNGVKAKPLLYGGTGSFSQSQQQPNFLPDQLEAGTHNVSGIAGLLAGVEYVRARTLGAICHHERTLTQGLAKALRQIDGVQVYARPDLFAQTGTLSLVVEGVDVEQVSSALAQRDVAVRGGLHCAPLAHKTAGTLETGAVRMSVSDFNTQAEVDTVVRIFQEIVSKG